MDTSPDSAAPDAGAADIGIPISEETSTQAPDAPWHDGIIAKDAAGVESLRNYAEWKDKAPAPLREFIDSNMTAARQKTEGMFKLPGADAKPEEWEPVYKALGRPDSPEGYQFVKPEKMPDGVEWNDEATKRFAPVAHKLGLTPSQVSALSEYQIAEVGALAAQNKASMEASIAAEKEALTKTFGATLPDTCLIAQQAGNKLGIPSAAFDPTSGEFWGVDALKVVATLARENAKLKMEDRGSNQGASPVTSEYAYAHAVSTGKHPDYEKYRTGDPEITARVNAGWKQMPKNA